MKQTHQLGVRIGFVACAALMAIWLASTFFVATIVSRGGLIAGLSGGAFGFGYGVPLTGVKVSFVRTQLIADWHPNLVPTIRGKAIIIPIWIPLLFAAVPTVFLFWRDHRRIPVGHCQKCGYNLTGNTSGICPECGERIPLSN